MARLRLGLGAVFAGAATATGWEPYSLWVIQLLGVAALITLLRRTSLKASFGLGYLFGLSMLSVSIGWIHVLGLPVAIALIAFEALFFGVLAVGLSLVRTLKGWPVWAALVWVAVEYGFSHFPLGGFGWTRLGFAAVDSPLAGLYPFIGVAGVSFCSALIAQIAAWVIAEVVTRGSFSLRRLTVAVVPLGLLLIIGAAGHYWTPRGEAQDSVTIGYVQGNVDGVGVEAMGRARSVTNNHLSETITLMAKARTGQIKKPDFVLWPENSTDIDPLVDPLTKQVVQTSVALAGEPILVGAVMSGPGFDERQTSALWWDPDKGVTARYNKRNLVPFGEFIPFRDFLLPKLPILKLVGAQSIPGTTPGVLDVTLSDGRSLALGDAICFELAYDKTIYETITAGAQVLVVQSNNATYGGTAQIDQQFAITRVRAMETRRAITVATTNSVSGAIDDFGRVRQRTDEFTSASDSITVPVQSSITPAVRIATTLDLALTLAAVAGLLWAITRRFRSGRSTPASP